MIYFVIARKNHEAELSDPDEAISALNIEIASSSESSIVGDASLVDSLSSQ
jgi:hypothetical protein